MRNCFSRKSQKYSDIFFIIRNSRILGIILSSGFNLEIEIKEKIISILIETFKEFYMEIYRRNKKKFVEKRNKNLKAYENLQKQEINSCC